MNIEEIDIYGTKYSIEYVETVPKLNPDADFTFGRKDGATRTILVGLLDSKGNLMPKEELELILLHEIVHVICDEGCYSAYSGDEAFVEWFAKNLRHLLPSLCQIAV